MMVYRLWRWILRLLDLDDIVQWLLSDEDDQF